MIFDDLYPCSKLKFEMELAFMTATQEQAKKLPPKHAYDFLKLINDEQDVLKQISMLKQFGAKPPLNMLLSLNFNNKHKFDMPEGCPPAKLDTTTHPDLLAPLGAHIVRLRNCLVGVSLPRFKKEEIFIKVIEMIPPCDVEVLVACKDKKLGEMFPNISAELVKSVYPQYVA